MGGGGLIVYGESDEESRVSVQTYSCSFLLTIIVVIKIEIYHLGENELIALFVVSNSHSMKGKIYQLWPQCPYLT